MLDTELATAINEGRDNVEGEIHTARQHALAALMGALRTGAYLREVRRRFGLHEWIPWIQQHCPGLPMKSAYRYKKLAEKFPHMRNSEEIVNLRQAYIAIGIFPDAPQQQQKSAPDLSSGPTPSGPDLQAGAKSMRDFWGAQLERLDLTTLEEPERMGLQSELTALREMLDSMIRRLTGLAMPLSGSATGKAAQ